MAHRYVSVTAHADNWTGTRRNRRLANRVQFLLLDNTAREMVDIAIAWNLGGDNAGLVQAMSSVPYAVSKDGQNRFKS